MTYVWAADYVAAESYILMKATRAIEVCVPGDCFKHMFPVKKAMWMFQTKNIIQTGQIIVTSHDLTLKCSWVREIHGNHLFQGNLGWWNIMIFARFKHLTLISGNVRHSMVPRFFPSRSLDHLRFIALPESEALTSCILRCSATFSWCRFRGAELSAATGKQLRKQPF